MKKIIICSLGMLGILIATGCGGSSNNVGTKPFKFTVKTDNPGRTPNDSFLIPTSKAYTYNYNVDCDSDGEYEATNVDGNWTCVYATAGTYTISIDGTFPNPWLGGGKFSNMPDKNDGEKVMAVVQWGDIIWESMCCAFMGCDNMNVTASDIPNLTQVKNMYRMFAGDKAIDQNRFNNWDTSHVEDFSGMFAWSTFNQPIGKWDTHNVKTMVLMFCCNSHFNQDIGSWDTGNVTNMGELFHDARKFNQDISGWDVSQVENMAYLFSSAESFNQDISGWDVSQVENMAYLFANAQSFNQNIGSWDVSHVTDMSRMFFSYNNVSSFNGNVEAWGNKTHNVRKMVEMFKGAVSFSGHDLSVWDASSVTTAADHEDFSKDWGTGNVEPQWP
jgi:surface protein